MPGAASVGTVKGGQKGSVPTMGDPGHLEVSPRMTCESYWVVTEEWDRPLGADFLAKSRRAGRQP